MWPILEKYGTDFGCNFRVHLNIVVQSIVGVLLRPHIALQCEQWTSHHHFHLIAFCVPCESRPHFISYFAFVFFVSPNYTLNKIMNESHVWLFLFGLDLTFSVFQWVSVQSNHNMSTFNALIYRHNSNNRKKRLIPFTTQNGNDKFGHNCFAFGSMLLFNNFTLCSMYFNNNLPAFFYFFFFFVLFLCSVEIRIQQYTLRYVHTKNIPESRTSFN